MQFSAEFGERDAESKIALPPVKDSRRMSVGVGIGMSVGVGIGHTPSAVVAKGGERDE